MSVDPKKKKLDGKRISQQSWEPAYQRRRNSRKKKEAVDPLRVFRKDANETPDENNPFRLFYNRSKGIIVNKRKLESALLEIERAVLQNPNRGKGPFSFCQEWKEKGKPIFNMVLVLFGFSAKTKTIIRRIMSGIDEVCEVKGEEKSRLNID